MATATQQGWTAERPVQSGRIYRCECGHELRFSGTGRHRVYFELGDAGSEDPVTNRVCPACELVLTGKNPQ